MSANMSKEDKHRRMRTLFDLQSGICPHCGKNIQHPDEAREMGRMNWPKGPSLDHVIPRSKGGVNAMTNLILTHRRCNNNRGDNPMTPSAVRLMLSLKARS